MEIVSGQIIDDSIYLATELLEIAKKKETRKEKSKKRQLARLVKDNRAIEATQQLTDQVIRIDSSKAAAKMFRSIVRKVKSKGFSLIDFPIKIVSNIKKENNSPKTFSSAFLILNSLKGIPFFFKDLIFANL